MSTATISHEGADLPHLREQPDRLEEGGVSVAARYARPCSLLRRLKCMPFVLLHLAPLAVFWTGADLRSLLLCAASYLVNMVGVAVGYHRYFAHRSYKTSRGFQFVLACQGGYNPGLRTRASHV